MNWLSHCRLDVCLRLGGLGGQCHDSIYLQNFAQTNSIAMADVNIVSGLNRQWIIMFVHFECPFLFKQFQLVNDARHCIGSVPSNRLQSVPTSQNNVFRFSVRLVFSFNWKCCDFSLAISFTIFVLRMQDMRCKTNVCEISIDIVHSSILHFMHN